MAVIKMHSSLIQVLKRSVGRQLFFCAVFLMLCSLGRADVSIDLDDTGVLGIGQADTLDYIDSIFIKRRARNYFTYGLATTSLGYGYMFYADPALTDVGGSPTNLSWVLAVAVPIANYGVNTIVYNRTEFYPAEVNMMHMGALNGIAHGAQINRILQSLRQEETSLRNYAYLFTLTSIVESQLAYRLSLRKNMDYDRTAAWQTGNIWGNVYGTILGYSLGEELGPQEVMMGSLGLFGSFGGVLASAGLHRSFPKTTEEYRALNAFASALLTYSAGLYRENPLIDPSIRNWSMFATNIAGMIGAQLFIKDTGFRTYDGLYIVGGTALGGGLGLLRYNALRRPGRGNRVRDVDSRILAGTGMMIGWGISYFSLRAIRSPTQVSSSKGRRRTSMTPTFDINPAGAIGFLEAPDMQQQILQMNGDLSLMRLRLSF